MQVAPAQECKRKFAFRITHIKRKTFFFAAERQMDMSRWMNKMGLAAIEYKFSAEKSNGDAPKSKGLFFVHMLESTLRVFSTRRELSSNVSRASTRNNANAQRSMAFIVSSRTCDVFLVEQVLSCSDGDPLVQLGHFLGICVRSFSRVQYPNVAIHFCVSFIALIPILSDVTNAEMFSSFQIPTTTAKAKKTASLAP